MAPPSASGQLPRRGPPGGRLLPAMRAPAPAPSAPGSLAPRRRSPRHARPTSAPTGGRPTAEQPQPGPSYGGGVNGPRALPQPQPQQQLLPQQQAAPPAPGASQRGRRPVSAPQFRRRARTVAPAVVQPDRNDLKTPADGANRPEAPTAPTKTSQGLQRAAPPVDTGSIEMPAFADGAVVMHQPDRSDLTTPMDGVSRPNSSLGRNAPTKTPPAPGNERSLGPMDSQMELPLPFSQEAIDAVGEDDLAALEDEIAGEEDADASGMWEPSPRTMDELDAEMCNVNGVARDGTPVAAEEEEQQRPMMRPASAPLEVSRPSSAQAGRFVERPSSSLGHSSGDTKGKLSAVTPRRLAALQQEVKQMKAERINPTLTKMNPKHIAAASAEAAATKPTPSDRPFKKRPARPASKTKTPKPAAGLTVQVISPNGELADDAAVGSPDEAGEITPATTTVGQDTLARSTLTSPRNTVAPRTPPSSIADIWAQEDSGTKLAAPKSRAAVSAGPIVVVDTKSSADALQDLLHRVDDLSARLTTSEQEKLNLSAKLKLLSGTVSPAFEDPATVQNQIVNLEMERQHLHQTTDGLKSLMDSVESSWKDKYCQLAAQSMVRGTALNKMQKDHAQELLASTAAASDAVCVKCSDAESAARQWREAVGDQQAQLKQAVAGEMSARKQVAKIVSSLEQQQEEGEFISAARSQLEADLEKERSIVTKLTDQLRSERRSTAQQLDTAKSHSNSLAELQGSVQAAQEELHCERDRATVAEQAQNVLVLELNNNIVQLQFRLSANETELMQSEGEKERSIQTEAELARSTKVSSAAMLRIQELEAELREAQEAASASPPREIALSAAQAGDAVVIQHLKDEATQLRARLIAVEVGAQEVAEEQCLDIRALRSQLSDLQAARPDETTDASDEGGSSAKQIGLTDDVKLSLAMSAQTASDVADHSNKLIDLASSVEGLRELLDNGTDTALDLHEHVGQLQELVIHQHATMEAEQATTASMAHRIQLLSSEPPVGSAREAVRVKKTDALQPTFSPTPAACVSRLTLVETTTKDSSTVAAATTKEQKTRKSRSGSGLRENGFSKGRDSRQKQESMRHALKQLKAELSKVHDGQDATLTKESSGGYGSVRSVATEVGGGETIGGALAARSSNRRPAKLSTVPQQAPQPSLLGMR